MLAAVFVLALGAGCQGEERALPDPARPPKPELSVATPLSSTPRVADRSTPEAARASQPQADKPAPLAVTRPLAERSPGPGPRGVAEWVLMTGDNDALPFVVIDKRRATVSMFDARGRLSGVAPALLGIAHGDVFAPGAAEKNMYDTRPDERITPAGRFVAERGRGENGEKVVWIDYDSGIALHAVLNVPGQRRRARLASSTLDDNRISYGCVNVPASFFRDHIWPVFERTRAIVYILPEHASAASFLGTLSASRPEQAAPE